jgi:antitoxin HicB
MPEKILSYTVIYHPAEEGGYWVSVRALPGCFTQGETYEEARAMAKEAIELYLESLQAHDEPIPEELIL